MNPRRKKRIGIILAVVLGLAAITGLILVAMGSNINLFYTPTEVINGKGDDKAKPEVGQRIRIGGIVVPGSVQRDRDSLKVSFELIDTGPAKVTVNYEGILPDLFREGQGIVAQGEMTSSTTLNALEVLAKHDENYMPPELNEALDSGAKHEKPTYTEAQLNGSQP